MGMLNCAQEGNNGTIAQLIVRGVSKVKHTFLKSFRGEKLEGEHGVWFGGE